MTTLADQVETRRASAGGTAARRLAALRAYGIGPREADATLDALAALAARICRTPRAGVALFDGRASRFLGLFGGGARRRDLAAGAVEILERNAEGDVCVMPDRTARAALARLELGGAPEDRFHAFALMRTPEGLAIGAVVVSGPAPQDIDEDARFALRTLAQQAMANLELRRVAASEARAIAALEGRNDVLATALEAERILKLEIDHRVKNSLQLVSSLLQMQVSRLTSPEAKEALGSAIGRVRAISFIHGALNRASTMDRVRLADHAVHLVEELRAQAPEGVRIVLDAGDVELPTQRASSFAILLNEFVTNSLKHAFPDGRGGTVTLSVHEVAGEVRVRFADDGVGHAAGARREGLGTRLMHALGAQLGCTLDLTSAPTGTELVFAFEAFPDG